MLVTTFWCKKIGTQKILKTTLFQDKLYSLKALAHYFTVLIHLATWRAAKLDIFTHFTSTNLPWCSLNSLTYAQSIYMPSCFLWVLNHSPDRTSLYYRCPKIFLYLPESISSSRFVSHRARMSGEFDSREDLQVWIFVKLCF